MTNSIGPIRKTRVCVSTQPTANTDTAWTAPRTDSATQGPPDAILTSPHEAGGLGITVVQMSNLKLQPHQTPSS